MEELITGIELNPDLPIYYLGFDDTFKGIFGMDQRKMYGIDTNHFVKMLLDSTTITHYIADNLDDYEFQDYHNDSTCLPPTFPQFKFIFDVPFRLVPKYYKNDNEKCENSIILDIEMQKGHKPDIVEKMKQYGKTLWRGKCKKVVVVCYNVDKFYTKDDIAEINHYEYNAITTIIIHIVPKEILLHKDVQIILGGWILGDVGKQFLFYFASDEIEQEDHNGYIDARNNILDNCPIELRQIFRFLQISKNSFESPLLQYGLY